MSYNELYLIYQLIIVAKNKSPKEKMDLLIRAALTSAAIDSISSVISEQFHNGESALVEVYLKALIDISEICPLLLGIHHMTFVQQGIKSWINKEMIITHVLNNWLHHLISFEVFLSFLNQEESYQIEKEKFDQQNQDNLANLNEDSIEYFTQMQALQTELKKQEEQIHKKWTYLLIQKYGISENIKNFIDSIPVKGLN